MSHLKLEDRKKISNMLAHKRKCCEIAEAIGCDPTTISKEVKRNRVICKDAKMGFKNKKCIKLDKWPFICAGCPHRYTDCCMEQMKYDASLAQAKYERILHLSRQGINLEPDEYNALVYSIKEGLKNKKSVYVSLLESGIDISISTVYRYIAEGKVPIKKIDLPYAVSYKKRKKKIKEYDYSDCKINRENRTYLDYLAYVQDRINEITTQMDFLGSIRTDSKSILTLIMPPLHCVFLFIIENKNSKKVVEIFDYIESEIGYENFCKIFPSILTDRDPSFADMQGIEFSKDLGAQRTNLFFCDAFKSNQKASVENMNKQLRKFFPKGSSIDNFTQDEITKIANNINETPIRSLDGFTPKEAFCKIFGEEIYNKLFKK